MIALELAEAGVVFLAWLLAVSALHKWLRPRRGVDAVRALLGLSASVARRLVWVGAGVEALTALLACFPSYQWCAAMLAACLYCVYALLLIRAFAQGHRDFDCGCTLSAAANPLSVSQVAKAVALSALGGLCAGVFLIYGTAAPSVTATLAALAGVTLYFAAEQLGNLAPLRSGEQS